MYCFDRGNLIKKKVTSEKEQRSRHTFSQLSLPLANSINLVLFARLLPCFVTAEEHCILTQYFSVLCVCCLPYTFTLTKITGSGPVIYYIMSIQFYLVGPYRRYRKSRGWWATCEFKLLSLPFGLQYVKIFDNKWYQSQPNRLQAILF